MWLIGGMVWWVVYLLCLLLCGIDFGASLSALLEITFAITAPPKAVAEAYLGTFGKVDIPLIVRLVGFLGWSVIIAFTLLIPAIIALILERLPNVVATLWPLASAEVWDFFQRYTGLLSKYHQMTVQERYTEGTTLHSRLRKSQSCVSPRYGRQRQSSPSGTAVRSIST